MTTYANRQGNALSELGRQVLETLEQYRAESEAGQGPVLVQKPAGELAEILQLEKWVREGGLGSANIDAFLGPYLDNTQHMHHPGYIGHQVAVPHPGASLADMVHGVANNPMTIYEMGPAAGVIERVLINWMLEKIGWFSGTELGDFRTIEGDGAGVLTHGGSLANLTALLAARAAASPDAWEAGVSGKLAILAPKTAHYSLARAVSIAGLGQNAICPVPVDAFEVLRPETLEETHAQAVAAGRRVIMVAANACATATGLYDPLDEIADFCSGHGLWLHVDGAHGASALLSARHSHRLKGIARADSVIWDAHKMLRTSSLCAAVLLRDRHAMAGTFKQEGSYILHDKDQPGFDTIALNAECTKAPLGTKLFWVLAMEGEQGLGDFVTSLYDDTLGFHALISAEPDFECPYEPQSNILCFRYRPETYDDDQQLAIRNAVIRRGNFYITTAEVSGTRYLRLAVMNPLTTRETIRALLDEIRDCASGSGR